MKINKSMKIFCAPLTPGKLSGTCVFKTFGLSVLFAAAAGRRCQKTGDSKDVIMQLLS